VPRIFYWRKKRPVLGRNLGGSCSIYLCSFVKNYGETYAGTWYESNILPKITVNYPIGKLEVATKLWQTHDAK
jgi:hypothetical protein